VVEIAPDFSMFRKLDSSLLGLIGNLLEQLLEVRFIQCDPFFMFILNYSFRR